MEVICLEEKAFYELVDTVVERVLDKQMKERDGWPWVSDTEAMEKLNITSPTTLQKLRDEGEIRFTQPRKKIILYDINSIYAWLDKHAKDPF